VATKRCSKCAVKKQVSELESGLATCNSCREKQQVYREQNRAKIKKYHQEFYRKNKQRILARNAAWRKRNIDKVRNAGREYARRNKDRARGTRLLREYGLTPDEFAKLAKVQNRRCAICRRKQPLLVDHCHKTGKVRGLLCKRCNTGLGQMKDSIKLLKRALGYLNGNDE
jgi:hypothetical protein